MSDEANKSDRGKLRYDLLPPYPLEKLAEVYTLGANKYGDHNWRKGMAWGRIIAALFRHLEAWRQGRTVDPEDGQHPLASVIWCCFTLMEFERLGIGYDDRLPKELVHIGSLSPEQVARWRP